MSAEEPNRAATPTPCEDIQGDGRWMSLVCQTALKTTAINCFHSLF